MKRGDFLRIVSIGLPLFSAGMISTMACSSDNDDDSNAGEGKTVVVIGAGVSGLDTAKQLKQKGFTVVVLEARSSVGGRLRTDRSKGFPFDEGAS